MDTNSPTPSSQAPQNPDVSQHSGTGALIGAAVIVVVLALGAYYIFMNDALAPTTPDEEAIQAQSDAQTDALRQTSNSDATGDIDADLEATNLGDVEGEMNATAEGF